MGFKNKVHQLKEVATRSQGKVSIVDKVNPYLRFIQENEKILVTGGRIYYENETKVPDAKIPKWFWEHWDRVTEEGRAKVNGANIDAIRKSLEKPKPVVRAEPEAPAVPRTVRKTTKKKAGKKRQRRQRVAPPPPEATESVEDGITG
jgi:hypothetical protein